jgi:hypothetical protein
VRNTVLRLAFILLFPTLAATSAQSPERFDSGPYKGFTKSPTEWYIEDLPEPLRVRSVQGSIIRLNSVDALDGVVFEIRDESGTVRAGVSDSRGRFRIRGVPNGTYRFKATKNGFSSIVGTVVVVKTVAKKSTITLYMAVGN